MKRLKTLTLLTTLAVLVCSCNAPEKNETVAVIFDTDMGPDYDDVGALAMLHALADKGEAEILATVASTRYEGVAAVLDVLNTYFNRPDLPIGVAGPNGLTLKDWQHWTDTLIAKYPHRIISNSEVPGAVSLYRKILSQQPDSSVTIITVGFLTNIADLLQSGPDEHSLLTGLELVKRKVNKLVSMAGRFPSGSEFNVKEDAAAAKHVFENFPRPVIYSGVEIGFRIKTGLPLIGNQLISDSPVKDVFRIGIASAEEDRDGRMSWDQTAVLVAVRGHKPWYTLTEGRITVDAQGNNSWDENLRGQFYLQEATPPGEVEDLINDLMQHQPN